MNVRAVFVGGPEDGARMFYSKTGLPSHFHLRVAGVHGVYLPVGTSGVFRYAEQAQDATCPVMGKECPKAP